MKLANPSYQQDVRAVAGNLVNGQLEFAESRLKRWAIFWAPHRVTIEDMWADVVTEATGYLSSLEYELSKLLAAKANGKTLVYRFQRGFLPIDEVIEEQEAKIYRCKNVGNAIIF